MAQNAVRAKQEADATSYQGEAPDDNCCIIFNGEYFKGDSATLCIDGENEKAFDGKSPELAGFSGRMYSYSCGANVSYEFGENRPHAGLSGAGTASNAATRGLEFPGSWNPISLTMKPFDGAGVTIYTQADCSGT